MSSDHVRFEELAAGYVLHALESEDERRFRSHLRHCDRCRRDVAAYAPVAADLAYASPPVSPPPELREAIRGAIHAAPPTESADPATTARTDPISPAAAWWRRPRPMLVAAAGLVLVLAAGAAVALWRTMGDEGVRSAPLAATVERLAGAGAATIPLRSPEGQQRLGVAVVEGRQVTLATDRIPVNNAARRIYVLWQLDASGQAQAVEGFDVDDEGVDVEDLGALPGAWEVGDRLAISIESGRTVPATPGKVIAVSGST